MTLIRRRGSAPVFSTVFDPRANALNFVRLLLATMVIVWHSFPLTGNDVAFPPLRQLLGEAWVDGFFAISGYLIVASWARDPHWWRYLQARFLRIMPAFWACLLLTAVVIAPFTTGVWGIANVEYVLRNAALWMFQYDIAGTPLGVPYEGVWNGSLWTLAWEFACYLGVMVIGVIGLLRFRWALPALFAVALFGAVVTSLGIVENNYVVLASRFGLMFIAGALVWSFRDRLPVSRAWVLLSVALVVASLWMPNYRLVAALPLAYLVLVAGAAFKSPRLRLRNDISYGVYIYAFPLQQIIAIYGGATLGVFAFAVLAILLTLPVAAASWFAVEKPALRLKRRRPLAAPARS